MSTVWSYDASIITVSLYKDYTVKVSRGTRNGPHVV